MTMMFLIENVVIIITKANPKEVSECSTQSLIVPPYTLNYRSNNNSDTIQLAKKMTKDSRENSHCEQSFQQLSQDPTKDRTDLTRRRTGHRSKYQMFFHLIFLKDKNIFVNKLGSLWGPNSIIG